jgi:DNA mismatch repair ATPase MutL
MTAQTQLKVTSHVGRDLLASAASFKNEAAVVWEYVVNSLQYVDAGVPPRVQVTIAPGRKGITISDNGRGMSANDLVAGVTRTEGIAL